MLSVAGGASPTKEYGLEPQSELENNKTEADSCLENNKSEADSCLEKYLGWAVADAFCAIINAAPSGNYLLFVVKL